MFFAMKRALAALLAPVARAAAEVAVRLLVPREQERAQQRRLVLALARQAQAAATLRQLALVADLARRLLPELQAQVVLATVAARVVVLPQVPALPQERSRASRRSSSSRARTARSTTRPRR